MHKKKTTQQTQAQGYCYLPHSETSEQQADGGGDDGSGPVEEAQDDGADETAAGIAGRRNIKQRGGGKANGSGLKTKNNAGVDHG